MEKYTYIRKTITWDSRRYEVRGKTEQEACEKLADLVVSLKRGGVCRQRADHCGAVVPAVDADLQNPLRHHAQEPAPV